MGHSLKQAVDEEKVRRQAASYIRWLNEMKGVTPKLDQNLDKMITLVTHALNGTGGYHDALAGLKAVMDACEIPIDYPVNKGNHEDKRDPGPGGAGASASTSNA